MIELHLVVGAQLVDGDDVLVGAEDLAGAAQGALVGGHEKGVRDLLELGQLDVGGLF